MKEFCVDLKIAKELKENGFPQGNNFYWYRRLPEKNQWKFIGSKNVQYLHRSYCFMPDGNDVLYSAPHPSELLKELPNAIVNGIYWMYIIKDFDNNFQVYYENTYINELKFRIINKKLSNCLALAWLQLKKLGYIK